MSKIKQGLGIHIFQFSKAHQTFSLTNDAKGLKIRLNIRLGINRKRTILQLSTTFPPQKFELTTCGKTIKILSSIFRDLKLRFRAMAAHTLCKDFSRIRVLQLNTSTPSFSKASSNTPIQHLNHYMVLK